jgi:DNA-binding MarR family transcriptional regulator
MENKPPETSKDACKKIARECTAVRVRLLNRVITAVYDDALRPLGLTVNQLNLLVAVCRMERVNAKQVGRVLQMDASTLSRNLDRMRKVGWLRLVAGEDGRTRSLKITAKGERLMVKAFPAWEEAQKRALNLLGADNVDSIEKMASGIWSGSPQSA